jgi:hypothetical protein
MLSVIEEVFESPVTRDFDLFAKDTLRNEQAGDYDGVVGHAPGLAEIECPTRIVLRWAAQVGRPIERLAPVVLNAVEPHAACVEVDDWLGAWLSHSVCKRNG